MIEEKINQRCTFAIISHPDAGKTTMTEKLLLLGGAIQMAGNVKARKSSRHATSDWMQLEKQRGISVTTSVMQFPYGNRIFNLLDTPGHEDFSEDTYRTLTAVDSALMMIDAVKGVESRTIKLMQVCRLRQTPILTFINKLDRETRDPIELLDEIESVLSIQCAPMTWPIGRGREFKGVYHLARDEVILYQKDTAPKKISGLDNPEIASLVPEDLLETLKEELELVEGAGFGFDEKLFLEGKQTPVFFGSALSNFGVVELLEAFLAYAPPPHQQEARQRAVLPTESKFSGFVFKIQANMDPNHRDRIAFLRVCSGEFKKGMRLYQVRTKRQIPVHKALTFMAGDRSLVEEAYPGDIIGLHNHGGIQIGDVFSQGESLQFVGIPHFAPELFRAVRPKDPLKMKALTKGLTELSEEGATQVFRPLKNNQIILGAVGVLQFDVVAHRLEFEYQVDCIYENISIATARWVDSDNEKALKLFETKAHANLATDGSGELTYLAPTMVNLQLAQERHPDIVFHETKEHAG